MTPQEIARQEAQAARDMRASRALQFFHDHPEIWPMCQICGQKKRPTRMTKDGRVEFHCRTGGHWATILSVTDEDIKPYEVRTKPA